jgi:hypothetical protein
MARQVLNEDLGQCLCVCRNQPDCNDQNVLLAQSLPRGITVPIGFLNPKTLVKYNSPKVTADGLLKSNAR